MRHAGREQVEDRDGPLLRVVGAAAHGFRLKQDGFWSDEMNGG